MYASVEHLHHLPWEYSFPSLGYRLSRRGVQAQAPYAHKRLNKKRISSTFQHHAMDASVHQFGHGEGNPRVCSSI